MIWKRPSYIDLPLWTVVVCLELVVHLPLTDTRVYEDMQHVDVTNNTEPPSTTPAPAAATVPVECYHMPRSECPSGTIRCKPIDPVSVFCCDANDFHFKEGLDTYMKQNTIHLHVLNPQLKELDISQSVFRRLASMSLTDGNIDKIVGQFPRHSTIACLNISNNNLTSAKLQPSKLRPFANLFNLTILDVSANNLTEFPLSLMQSNRKIEVDFSGNDYLPCGQFQKAMDSTSLVTFRRQNRTFCALDLRYGSWFDNDTKIVQLDYVKTQKELDERCRDIIPANINCTCIRQRIQLIDGVATYIISVDCSQRQLKEMPKNLPNNTVELNVSYNNIVSLEAVDEDPSYSGLSKLYVDYNDIADIVDLEGSKFIDNFMFFSISNNKLKTIHPHVFSNKFNNRLITDHVTLIIGGNYIHCDCNTEKVIKPWLIENYKIIVDYKKLACQDNMGAVVDLIESQVCHSPRDWTDYISYIITLEVLVLVLLVSKVSYDYWVFKTAGYLPWPANKMPRLPCDWLCE